MTQPEGKLGLGTLALHAGHEPLADPTLSRAVPIYATTSYLFRDTRHAADLFALKEFGNIFSRLMNPTCDALAKARPAAPPSIAARRFSKTSFVGFIKRE